MTNLEKRIKLEDVLGNKYYNYNLTSSNYNPSLNSSITLTCLVTNILGDEVSGKNLQLSKNGNSLGASYQKTTDSNGVATWSITCTDGGLQTYSIDTEEIEIFVDNKANSTHTHTTNNITDFPNLSNVATSGSYNDLTNKPTIPTIPTNVSSFTNDSGYLTSHQDITGKLDKTQTSYKGKNVVVDSSSGEITFEDKNNHTHSSYLTSSDITGKENSSNKVKSTSGWSSTTTDDHYPSEKLVKSSLDNKVDKETGKGLFSGSYSDLTNKPSFTQDSNITSSTTGRYKIGTININGNTVTMYGKDTNTVYEHPIPQTLGGVKNYGLYKTTIDAQGHIINAGNVEASDLPSHTHTVSGITDFPSTMTPTSHTHGYITNGGELTSTISSNTNIGNVVVTNAKTDMLETVAQLPYSKISGTPSLSNVATSGSYNDLSNKPSIPSDVSELTDTQNTAFTPKSHTHAISDVTNLQSTLNDKAEESDLLDLIYPIGSIYMDKEVGQTVCPIELTLGGTWTRIEEKFLYASPNGQGVGTTGGSADAVVVEHNHTQKSHNHTQNSHNHTQNGHSHGTGNSTNKYFITSSTNGLDITNSKKNATSGTDGYLVYSTATGSIGEYTSTQSVTATNQSQTATNQATTAENNATGESGTGKNMPPYVIVNVWERTA